MKKTIPVVFMMVIGFALPSAAAQTSSALTQSVQRAAATAVIQADFYAGIPPEKQAEVADKKLAALIKQYPRYKKHIESVRWTHHVLVESLRKDGANLHGQLTTEDSVTTLQNMSRKFQGKWKIQSLADVLIKNPPAEASLKNTCIRILNHVYRYDNMYAGLGYLAPEVSHWAESHAWACDWNSHFEMWGSFYNSFSKAVIKIN